ncbi:MAG: bluetail domain-containing putative surface protein [Prochlorococcus sp.]
MFLSANGSGDGFQPKNDLLVEITGYSGNLSDIQII